MTLDRRSERVLEELGREWADAAARERNARRRRDAGIVRALEKGAGVREVARIVDLNPNTVIDIRRKAERETEG